jgi:signal transduction histidine kinase
MIPEAERELVFQRFYRGLDTEVDGSGLGLAIEETQPGGQPPGTRAVLRLPAQPALPSQA